MSSLIILLSVEIGLFGLIVFLFWFFVARLQKREAALRKDPFTTRLFRSPGQSASEKFGELYDSFISWMGLTGLFAGMFIGYLYAILMPAARGLGFIIVIATIGLIALTISILRLRKPFREARQLRLGADGERHTAQAIQSLAGYGCEMFHDLCYKDASGQPFNLDHVVLTNWGVVVIETKARSKLTEIKGKEKATVKYDGQCLRFPHHYNTSALDQVRANTTFLARQLHDRTGEKVRAQAVISLPGWWVDTTVPNSDVIVCNPLNLWKYLAERTDSPLDPAQRRRISAYLAERSKLVEG